MTARGVLEAGARAAQLLAGRRTEDPLRRWAEPAPCRCHGVAHEAGPTAFQASLLGSPKPEAWGLGANRSGKTDALAALIAALVRFGHPDPRPCYLPHGLELTDRAVAVWAISLTFPVLRDTLQPKLFDNGYTAGHSHPPFIPPWEVPPGGWNATAQTLRLKNGSLIAFKSCDSGRGVFQAAGRDLIAFDEVPPKPIYTECTFRKEAGQRLLIRGAATLLPPEGVIGGVTWLYRDIVKPWVQSHCQNATLDVFTAALRDNPHIDPGYVAELEARYPEGSLERRIRINGELLPSIGGTLAYPAFARAMHVSAQLGPHAILRQYPLRLCCDFNVSPLVWLIAQRVNETWCVYDEIVLDQASVPAAVAEFRRRYPTHGAPLLLQGDATAAIRTVQTGRSTWHLVQELLQDYPVPVQLHVPRANPAVLDRLNALNRQLVGPEGRIGVQVAPGCVELIQDFEEVLREARGGIKKTTEPFDCYSRRTHATDALGCAVAFTDPVPRGGWGRSPFGAHRVPRPAYGGGGIPTDSPRRPNWLRRGPAGDYYAR